jgi:hypothetical protein
MLKYLNPVSLQKLTSTNISLTNDHNPIYTNNLNWSGLLSYDRINKKQPNDIPEIIKSKEETAPEFIFNTY